MRSPVRAWLATLLIVLPSWWQHARAGETTIHQTGAAEAASTMLPIATAIDLRQHMLNVPRSRSPLGRLSDAGLRRFVADLQFGPNGIGGFSIAELEAELSDAEILPLLQLFGLDAYAAHVRGNGASTGAAPVSERWPELDRAAMGELEQREAELEDFGNGQTSDALSARYEALFGHLRGSDLSRLQPQELRAYWNAALQTQFRTRFAPSLADLRTIMAALQSRGLAQASHERALYQSLVAARQLDEAGTFLALHPDASDAPAPRLSNEPDYAVHGRSVLRVTGSQDNQWRRQTLDPDALPSIVLVAGLGCGYSRAALAAIQAHTTLGPTFARHALVLFNQSSPLVADSFRRWEAEHPSFKASIAWRDSEWPEFDLRSMPAFYFLDDNRVVEVVVGWPAEGKLKELEAALERLNLSEANLAYP